MNERLDSYISEIRPRFGFRSTARLRSGDVILGFVIRYDGLLADPVESVFAALRHLEIDSKRVGVERVVDPH